MPPTEKASLDEALNEYKHHKIIELCDKDTQGFYSGVFPRCKKEGTARVILNLRGLNQFIEKVHFKMDTIKEVIHLIGHNYYFASIDFKNAYFSVPVAPHLRHYFRFLWQEDHYQFTCLPQGLSSAPRIFTKLMKPVFAYLRSHGYTAICYIDDCILISESEDHLISGINFALRLFDSLGLTVNVKKSVLHPVQEIEFLGFLLNSQELSVKLTQRKIQKIYDMGKELYKKQSVTIRQLASFIGNLVAMEPAMKNAPLYYKPLEIVRNEALKSYNGNYEAYICLSSETKTLIDWWIQNIDSQFRKIETFRTFDFEVYSDASLTGWGGSFGSLTTGGLWGVEDLAHINILELKAALFTLKALCSHLSDKYIQLRMDNTTAVACVNNMGSIKPSLLSVTKQLIQWADSRNITLTAAHIPGVDNVIADKASREFNIDIEWMLSPQIFHKLCAVMGTPDIDLFATRINKQLPKFISWRPDPEAFFTDAFLYSWCDFNYGYVFPPFSLVSRVLQKIRQHHNTLLVILPLWTTRPWFSQALELLVEPPYLLPRNCLVLPQDPQAKHPLNKLTLAAMKLSGKHSLRMTYRNQLQTFSSIHGEMEQNPNIGCISTNGCYFVMKGKLVHFALL